MLTVTCLHKETMERARLTGESPGGMRGGAPQPAALINVESLVGNERPSVEVATSEG